MAQMARRCDAESGGSVARNSGRKRRNAPKTVGRSDTLRLERSSGLARQPLAELVHEAQGVLGALMSQMQINHGAGDLLMTEQFLNRVQMRAGFRQMRGETVAQ